MKVVINLGNVQAAIEQVEAYRNRLKTKHNEFLQRLAGIGVEEARVRFEEAVYDGTNDVEVDNPVWIADDCIAVRAHGNAITFIEFGTGVHYPATHPKAAEFGFTRGGYGEGRGKNDFWLYRGEPGTNGKMSTKVPGLIYTHGNPANRCMWESGKVIRQELLRIAKEVFSGD